MIGYAGLALRPAIYEWRRLRKIAVRRTALQNPDPAIFCRLHTGRAIA